MLKNNDNLLKALEIVKTLATLDMNVVPIEPTQIMIDAAKKIYSDLSDEQIKEIYAAMLLAHDKQMLV